MLRLQNVSPGRRVAQAQTSSPKTAPCLPSAPALYLKTLTTTSTTFTPSHSPPLTQPPSSQAAPATAPGPQASPAHRNTLCPATTTTTLPPLPLRAPPTRCHAIPQHLPALMEAPYQGLKLFSLRPHATFQPRAE